MNGAHLALWLYLVVFVANAANQIIGAYVIFGRASLSWRFAIIAVLVPALTIGNVAILLEGSVQSPAQYSMASALCLCSFALYYWATHTTKGTKLGLAFSTDAPKTLFTSGPYRWIRHPFYISYVLYWTSPVLAGGTYFSGLALLVMTLVYTWAANIEEARFYASELRDAYTTYCRSAGKFFPRLSFKWRTH